MKKANVILVMLVFIVSACNSAQSVEITQMPVSTITPTKMPTATSTATNTPAVEPTSTETPLLYSITFRAFHDYSGNGIWDNEDPAIADVTSFTEINGKIYSCTTGKDGICNISDVPEGEYHFELNAPDRYRWLLPDVWSGIDIEKGIKILINHETVYLLPLAYGTSDGVGLIPIPKGFEYWIGTWYDLDKTDGSVENWLGQTANAAPFISGHWPIDTSDGHYAIDYFFDIQTPILASDACKIIRIEQDSRQADPNDHIINCQSLNSAVVFDYGHVNPIEELSVGDQLYRGQLIGYSSRGQDPNVSNFLTHLGITPLGCHAYSCSIDPYPNFWTTDDFDLARVYMEE